MKTAQYYETASLADLYTWFASEAAPTSPTWERVCLWIAQNDAVQAQLATLPESKRQPNLFLAALKYLGATTEPGEDLASFVDAHWAEIEQVVVSRRTQTNEVGRCAVLAPVLASLPQPIALIEVGMSAGACLALDRYGYRWTDAAGEVLVEHAGHGSDVTLGCNVSGSGLPLAVPEIVWRAGVDLNLLDPADPDSVGWLRALVWPGEEARERRLASALATAAEVPIVAVEGDATEALPGLVARAPAGATVVVIHSAVLAYFSAEACEAHMRVLDTLRDQGVHWITNEGARVVPGVRDLVEQLPAEPRPHFVLTLDGVPLARVGGHGAWLDWFPGADEA